MTTADVDRIALARKELVHSRLTASGADVHRRHHISRRGDTRPAPLSAAQRQLWYLHRLAPDSGAYNELVTIRKDGPFDVAAFTWAFNELVTRHEAWRTTFATRGDEPCQIVHPHQSIDLPMWDLTHLPFDDAEAAAAAGAAEIASISYDLARGPLLRPMLVKLTDSHHRLYLAMHHLIFDGVSLYRIVLPELVALYRAGCSGAASPLPEPPIQYADYAIWERDWAAGADVQRRLAQRRDRLAGLAASDVPLDRARPARQTFRGSMLALSIDALTTARLKNIGAKHDATLFHVLAAIYGYWLHRYTEHDDVVFGTAHDLRAHPELQSMVGYCLTPVVLRVTVPESATCISLLHRMRTEVLDAISAAVPFDMLVAALAAPRDQRRNPVFQTALVLEPPMESPDPTWSIHQMETRVGELMGWSKFDLSVELDERADGTIEGRLIFNTDLFDTDTATLMVAHLERLMCNAAAAPDTPLAELSAPDENDRHRQLHEFNAAAPPDAVDACIHDLVAAAAARTPDAPAVRSGERQLTYRELQNRSHEIAASLAAAGAGPGTIVATRVDRSIDLVPSLLAVMLTGAAYLPLDHRNPASRSLFMLGDAGASILLTDTATPLAPVPDGMTIVTIEPGHQSPCVTTPFTPAPSDPTALAYVMYTSGSTGTPKGVLVEHRNVVNLMTGLPATLGMSATDTLITVASVAFDVSVGDIFCTLAIGATVVLAARDEAMDPRALEELITRNEATVVSATPTTWSMLIGAGWPGKAGLLAISAGEQLHDHLAEELRRRCRAVWNGSGPTEATVYHGGAFVHDGEPVSVGTPLPGVRVYVMDDRSRLLPCGVPGEIVVAGRGVTRGYLNRKEETQRRFRPDPFVNGDRMYRTGDRGRLLPDGRLQHLGRYDAQVKLHGFRVELGEVESVLIEHPQVREVAVNVHTDPVSGTQLVAYVVADADAPDAPAIRRWTRSRLPAHMVPGVVVMLPALPRTSSGKLDRAALPAPDAPPAPQVSAPAPQTPTQLRLTELWTQLLPGATHPQSDFFDAGGHSVLATRLLLDVERRFGVTIAVADFLDQGTSLAGLARLIDNAGATSLPGQRGQLPNLFFVYPDLPSSMSMRHLSVLCGRENHLCPLIAPAVRRRRGRPTTVEDVAAPLLRSIRATQPTGPYRLIGYSFGGLLAYELARLLDDGGDQVSWLGLLDTPTPAAVQALMRQWKTPEARMARLRRPQRTKLIAEYSRHASWLAREKLITAGILDRRPGEHIDIRHAWQIMRACAPHGHHVPMHLFVTTDTIGQTHSESLGWADVHRGPLHIHHAPGDHDSLLSETFAGDFTELVMATLRAQHPHRYISTDTGS